MLNNNYFLNGKQKKNYKKRKTKILKVLNDNFCEERIRKKQLVVK